MTIKKINNGILRLPPDCCVDSPCVIAFSKETSKTIMPLIVNMYSKKRIAICEVHLKKKENEIVKVLISNDFQNSLDDFWVFWMQNKDLDDDLTVEEVNSSNFRLGEYVIRVQNNFHELLSEYVAICDFWKDTSRRPVIVCRRD